MWRNARPKSFTFIKLTRKCSSKTTKKRSVSTLSIGVIRNDHWMCVMFIFTLYVVFFGWCFSSRRVLLFRWLDRSLRMSSIHIHGYFHFMLYGLLFVFPFYSYAPTSLLMIFKHLFELVFPWSECGIFTLLVSLSFKFVSYWVYFPSGIYILLSNHLGKNASESREHSYPRCIGFFSFYF